MKSSLLSEVTGHDTIKIRQLCDKIFPDMWHALSAKPTRVGSQVVSGILKVLKIKNLTAEARYSYYVLIDDMTQLQGVLGASYRRYEEHLRGLRIIALPSAVHPELSNAKAWYSLDMHTIFFNIEIILKDLSEKTASGTGKLSTDSVRKEFFRILSHEMAHVIDLRKFAKYGDYSRAQGSPEWALNHWEISAEMTRAISIVNEEIFKNANPKTLVRSIESVTLDSYNKRVVSAMHHQMSWLLGDADEMGMSRELRRRKYRLEQRVADALIFGLRVLSRIRPELRSVCASTLRRLSAERNEMSAQRKIIGKEKEIFNASLD